MKRIFSLDAHAKKITAQEMKGEDPCWEGYEMIGTKKGKGGKEVPNCVPKKKKTASKSFEDWANEELSEDHHENSLDDGVLTFDEWVNDELNEEKHSKLGPGFSFDDWAREEEQEEESHHDADGDEHDDEECHVCDECEEHEEEEHHDIDENCEECDECMDCVEHEEDTGHDMHDDWQDECKVCEYETDKSGKLHGGCHECDMHADWNDEDIMLPMSIVQKKSESNINVRKIAKKAPAWQRSEGKSKAGGLNEKGRASYNRATGGNLQAPVTEKNPTGKRKKRRKSFCARSKGQMKMHNIDCSKTPDKRICKARRRWKC